MKDKAESKMNQLFTTIFHATLFKARTGDIFSRHLKNRQRF